MISTKTLSKTYWTKTISNMMCIDIHISFKFINLTNLSINARIVSVPNQFII